MERIKTLRAALRGDKLGPAAEAMQIERALPHGHVAAALGMALGLGAVKAKEIYAATVG